MQLKRKQEGTLTVEAAAILSFVILIVYVFLVLCLILHDRTVLSAAAQRMAQAALVSRQEFVSPETGSTDWETFLDSSPWSRINSTADRMPDTEELAAKMEDQLVVSTGVRFTIQMEGGRALVSYAADVKPIGGLYGLGAVVSSISGTESKERTQPETTLRMAKALLFGKLKGAGKKE